MRRSNGGFVRVAVIDDRDLERQVAAEEQRIKAAREAEAKRLADEAAEELRKAEEANDIGAQVEAEERQLAWLADCEAA